MARRSKGAVSINPRSAQNMSTRPADFSKKKQSISPAKVFGAVAALAWQNRENAVDYLTLQPHYLRAPQAERARAARLAAEGKA